MTVPTRGRWGVWLALLAVYIIWGSTYLVIRIAITDIPPLLMAGIRFSVAGGILFTTLRLRGSPMPTGIEWRNAALIGFLLLVGGNGVVTIAEQWIDSGLTALVVATTPIWAVMFAGLWGIWPGKIEWAGMGLGVLGVAVLSTGSGLSASPLGTVLLLLATASWAFGTVLSRHLRLPGGLMASAAQMLTSGAAMLLLGAISGERISAFPSLMALLALGYLIVFGSLIAFSAYIYLIGHARPTLTTSYAYVNPVVAVLLGATVGEPITILAILALALIVAGVMLVVLSRDRQSTNAPLPKPAATRS